MNPEELAERIESLIESATGTFDADMQKTQNNLYAQVLAVVKDLKLNSDGTIKTNLENLKVINRLRAVIKANILTTAYQKRVKSFLSNFSGLKNINDEYFGIIAASFQGSKEAYSIILGQSIDLAQNSLLQAGIDSNVVEPIKKLLQQNITSGGLFNDLVDQLREDIKGSPNKIGRLQRYSQQITTDALNQYSAEYTKKVSEDLNLEWYYYSGGTKSTSRRYCKKRAGNYYHKKEVEESASERWGGKIPATNSRTIFTYRGGFQCKHLYMPVLITIVPESVVKRARDNGYYEG